MLNREDRGPRSVVAENQRWMSQSVLIEFLDPAIESRSTTMQGENDEILRCTKNDGLMGWGVCAENVYIAEANYGTSLLAYSRFLHAINCCWLPYCFSLYNLCGVSLQFML